METPLNVCKIKCPVCDVISDQWSFKFGVYKTEETDLDLKPVSYEWKDKANQGMHPPLYYMWQCPACKFTAGKDSFEDPSLDTSLQLSTMQRLLRNYLNVSTQGRGAMKILGDQVNPAKPDFPQAVKLTLAAALPLENIRDVCDRDSLTLARYYLRLAWLYSDIQAGMGKGCQGALDELFSQLQTVWPDAPRDYGSALELADKYYDVALVNSEVPRRQGIVYVVTQIQGRISLKLGDLSRARAALRESHAQATRAQREVKELLKPCSSNIDALPPERRNALIKSIRKITVFLAKTEELLETLRPVKGAQAGR